MQVLRDEWMIHGRAYSCLISYSTSPSTSYIHQPEKCTPGRYMSSGGWSTVVHACQLYVPAASHSKEEQNKSMVKIDGTDVLKSNGLSTWVCARGNPHGQKERPSHRGVRRGRAGNYFTHSNSLQQRWPSIWKRLPWHDCQQTDAHHLNLLFF